MTKDGLADVQSENIVIGSILNDLSLIHEDSNTLIPHDFTSKRNQILYAALFNIANAGAEKITLVELDNYLQQNPEQYAIFAEQEGLRALTLDGNFSSDRAVFSNNINKIKKYALLRDLVKIGIDVSEFCDTSIVGNYAETLDTYSIDDIFNRIKEKINTVEDKNYVTKAQTSKEASEGIRELFESLKVQPEIGEFLDGDIYNYVVRGARYGKFYINSAPSGAGKTRNMVGNACSLAYPYIDKNNKIVVKENYFPVLYIATEQDPSEIQTLILSYISGVPEDRLLESAANLTENELWRIETAIQIMDYYKGNFNLEWIPDPTIAIIRTKVGKYVYKQHVHFVFYDYIFSSPGLLGEFRDLKIREDVALMMLSNTLKELAVEYQIFIMSATQISGEVEKNVVRNQNSIRGSKAIVDKVDVGSISVRIPPEEMDNIQTLLSEGNFETPNIVMDVYKNRRGKMNCIKIFRKFDYGTCRVKDLFATDMNYGLVTDYPKFLQNTNYLTIEELMKRGVMNGNSKS